jgi:hypothetical protein
MQIATPERIKGPFNKDILLNSYFEHTDLFSVEAQKKLKTGKYCNEVYGSKKYNLYWEEQIERCLHGYINPVTKVHIEGYHYGFLNFKPMKIIENPNSAVSRRVDAFPRFWPIHYFYFKCLEYAKQKGLNNILLKPRGTGFSELHSWMASSDYSFRPQDPSFFFVADKGFLDKDGILTKCWQNLDFLNSETERAFLHHRGKKDNELHKRASYIDPTNGAEIRTGGDIIGRIIDHVRKVRGARGTVYWEESGSFPLFIDAWIATRALVEQGGVKFARQIAWGTGGEQGPGIMGLEEVFRNPKVYGCLPYDNCWEETQGGKDIGFFFPTWASMDRFMDKWGNTDFLRAKAWLDEDRAAIFKHSPNKYDKHIAEYPYTPDEALMRLTGNHFPVSLLQQQLRKVESSQDIKGILKHGRLQLEEGEVKFVLDFGARPINEYPHKQDEGLDGCVTMVEAPLRDDSNSVPINLYQIIVDPFYVDEPDEVTSLGAIYVYKKANNLFPSEADMLVAWYVGRPRRGLDFHRILFNLARFYNAQIQSEILGGGQNILDYAKQHNLLQYCAYRPSIFNTDKEELRTSQRAYFVNMNKDLKKQCLQDLADWLLTERALKLEGEKTRYILNLELVYDKGLLQELIKFSQDGNFDRISALLVLMATRRELERHEVEETRRQNGGSIFARPLYTDGLFDKSDRLPLSEMLPPRPPGGDIAF